MALTATAFFSRPEGEISARAEEDFFRSIRVRTNTTKQTVSGRLGSLDSALIAYARRTSTPINNVLDVGVSTGVTTRELYDALCASGYSPSVVGTDLMLEAAILALNSYCKVLTGVDGKVLQYDVLGKAVRPWISRRDYFTGMVLVRSMMRAWSASKIRASLTREREPAQRVLLVSPKALNCTGITLMEDDLLARNGAFAARFDAIRAANIIGLNYFPKETICAALNNLASYLSGPGSLLMVGRTRDRENHGTLYELDRQYRLNPVLRVGRGSEIEDLVTGVRPRG